MTNKRMTLRLPEQLAEELQRVSSKTALSIKDLVLLAILSNNRKSLRKHK